jgi:hypothetical protein
VKRFYIYIYIGWGGGSLGKRDWMGVDAGWGGREGGAHRVGLGRHKESIRRLIYDMYMYMYKQMTDIIKHTLTKRCITSIYMH